MSLSTILASFERDFVDDFISVYGDSVVANAELNKSTLLELTADQIVLIGDTVDNLISESVDNVIEETNRNLNESNTGYVTEEDAFNHRDVIYFYLIESIKNAYRRIHSATIALQVEDGDRGNAITSAKVNGSRDINRAVELELGYLYANLIAIEHNQRGISSYTWVTMGDDRVRATHDANSGLVFDWDNPNPETGHPGFELGCFAGHTEVKDAGTVHKAFRRWYAGESTKLVLSNGSVLHVTPNHPILTEGGWVAVKDINIGEYIFEKTNERFDSVESNADKFVPTISEIFDTLERLGVGGYEARVNRTDFHGDVTDDEVYIVDTNGLLLREAYVSACEKISEFFFSLTNSNGSETGFNFDGTLKSMFKGLWYASDRVMGFADLVRPLFGTHLLPLERFALALCSKSDVIISENTSNYSSGNIEFLGDTVDAVAFCVHGTEFAEWKFNFVMHGFTTGAVDTRFCEIGKNSFVGSASLSGNIYDTEVPVVKQKLEVVDKIMVTEGFHVYNLETENGYYTANSVIVHNCRCHAIPMPNVTNKLGMKPVSQDNTMTTKTCPIRALSAKHSMPILNRNNTGAVAMGSDPDIVKVNIFGVIGEEWDENTTSGELMNWNGISDTTKEIHAFISSAGGDLFVGIEMYNLLKNHPAKVYTYNLSNVSSAATLPFLAGDVRVMPKGTSSLIHDPWSCGCFNQYEAEAFKERLKSYADQLVDIYTDTLNLSRDEVVALMKGSGGQDGTIILSGQSLDIGFSTTSEMPESTTTANAQSEKVFALTLSNQVGETLMKTNRSRSVAPKKDESTDAVELTLPEANARIAILMAENSRLKMEQADETEEGTAPNVSASVKTESGEVKTYAEIRAELKADLVELQSVHNIAEEMGVELDDTIEDSMTAKRKVLASMNVPNAEDAEAFPDAAVQSSFDWFVSNHMGADGEEEFDDTMDSVVNGDRTDTAGKTTSAFGGMEKL